MTDESPWYSLLREQWKPEHVRLLMIAESAPDERGDPDRRRFFYAKRLGADNLFRSVVDAMYGAGKDELKKTGKEPWLRRLRDDGFFLIDLAPYPVNALSARERSRVLLDSVPACVAKATDLRPERAVVVKADLFDMLHAPLRQAGVNVTQEGPIAFPLGNMRAAFRVGFNQARET